MIYSRVEVVRPAYPLGPRMASSPSGAGQGAWAPSNPLPKTSPMSRPSRNVWVKIRASEAERAAWHGLAATAGVSLSRLVRQAIGRVRPWTVAQADLERERVRELARIGNNLNQLARWANTHKGKGEAVEVISRLVVVRRALDALMREGRDDAH